jgi:cell shape-determining protein MreC
LGGVFLKGLVVGVVGSVVKQKQELFQDITIIPSVDLSNLEEVVVILPNKEGE